MSIPKWLFDECVEPAQESALGSQDSRKSELFMPQWFLDERVRTGEELEDGRLFIINNETPDNAADSKGLRCPKEDSYQVQDVVYEPLSKVFTSTSTSYRKASSSKTTKCFATNAVYLRLPDKHRGTGGIRFLTAVVERFAKDAGADLMTLDIDDVVDLAELFNESQAGSRDENTDSASSKTSESDTDITQDLDLESFQFSALFSSSSLKRIGGSLPVATPVQNPLMIHIREVFKFHDAKGKAFLKSLRNAIKKAKLAAIVVLTSAGDVWNCDRSRYYNGPCNSLVCPECCGEKEVIQMAPISSKAQRALFDSHQKMDESYEQGNIRLLQRSIRRISAKHSGLDLAQPFSNWLFLKGTPAEGKFANAKLPEAEVSQMIKAIGQDLNEDSIKWTILQVCRRQAALDDWCKGIEKDKSNSKWSSFPAEAQVAIAMIEQDQKGFEWEQRFLSLLISPEEVEEGWSDIALDPETKENIEQLIQQPLSSSITAYGILNRAQLKGALFYGPPGTGKTQLARVLARELKVTTICASAADLENMYVGESEKAIKGLFNLGRMLSPSIIFIDEADALFRVRNSGDRGSERSRTNQLLQEMDGLKKSKSRLFTIVATNFPSDLDPAVLRRIPNRIYIGLPGLEARIRILEICIRDEALDPDVNINLFAQKLRGYSGSDITTLCVKAALFCNASLHGNGTKRVLRKEHFERAFENCSSTVSNQALVNIKTFARQYDPSAAEKMTLEDDRESIEGFVKDQQGQNALNFDLTNGIDHSTRPSKAELSTLENLPDLTVGRSRTDSEVK